MRTSLQSLWQSPFIERFIGTLRRELRNHVIVFSEAHVQRPLREFMQGRRHVARPHEGLRGGMALPTESLPNLDGPTTLATIPVLGGLHHTYVRLAA